jgi:hypothetical protein
VHRYVIAGAAGGQGTTTVALATAALLAGHTPTVLVARDPDAVCAVAAVPHPMRCGTALAPGLVLAGDDPDTTPTVDQLVVVDAGPVDTGLIDWTDPDDDVTRWIVLRGPCYLALRRLTLSSWTPDAIVLLTEPDRALRRADVEDVTALPVAVELTTTPTVARTIDAGLFLTRLPTLAAFRPLATLIARHHDPTRTPADAA